MWDASPEGKGTGDSSAQGHYIVRLRVTNNGNEDARDVEVMMIRLWVVDGDGKRLVDPSFLRLMLQWSWWTDDGSPARWLERLPAGTFKHCDLLIVSLGQGARPSPTRRRGSKKVEHPKPWMTFVTAFDPSDATGHSPLRKPPGRYQLDFVTAMSNAAAIYRTAHISFGGWRDGAAEMFGDGGGLQVRVTKS